MTVYLDILFVLNMFVNYFILLATSKLSSGKVRFLRMIAGAALGALYSFVILMPKQHLVVDILLRLLASVTIVLAVYGFKSAKRFLRLIGTFFGVSFVYAGIMMGLWLLFKPGGMLVNNGIVYFNISPVVLVVSTLVCYILVTVYKKISRRNEAIHTGCYVVEIMLGDKTVKLKALLDTGNSLVDLFSDAPVVVAEYEVIEELLPVSDRAVFADKGGGRTPESMKDRFRLIPYSAIESRGLLPAFKPDYVVVHRRPDPVMVKNVVVAVSRERVSDQYHALIGCELLNQERGERVYELKN